MKISLASDNQIVTHLASSVKTCRGPAHLFIMSASLLLSEASTQPDSASDDGYDQDSSA